MKQTAKSVKQRRPSAALEARSWTDLRPGWFKPIARRATCVEDRHSHTLAGATQTLERLAAAAEASSEG